MSEPQIYSWAISDDPETLPDDDVAIRNAREWRKNNLSKFHNGLGTSRDGTWMKCPTRDVDEALAAYAAPLRDEVKSYVNLLAEMTKELGRLELFLERYEIRAAELESGNDVLQTRLGTEVAMSAGLRLQLSAVERETREADCKAMCKWCSGEPWDGAAVGPAAGVKSNTRFTHKFTHVGGPKSYLECHATPIRALIPMEGRPKCDDCNKAAAHAYSDATTPGFFRSTCPKHTIPMEGEKSAQEEVNAAANAQYDKTVEIGQKGSRV